MADLLKNKLNYDTLREFALIIQAAHNEFPIDEFLIYTMDETWDSLELKARGRKICLSLGKYLPADCHAAISIIDDVADVCLVKA